MKTSIFLAKLIGPLALALGLGVLFNRDAVRAVLDEFIRNRAIMFLAGLITFPAGLAIVLTHNVWVADWPVHHHDRRLAHRHLRRIPHRRAGGRHPVRPPRLRAAERRAVRRRHLGRARRHPLLLRLLSDNQPARENTHEQARLARRPRHPEGDHRTDLSVRARSTRRRTPRRTCACRSARSCSIPPRASRRCRSTTPSGPYTDDNLAIDVEQGLKRIARRMGARARRRRGIRRPPDPAGRQRQRHAASTSRATSPTRRSRCARSATRR